MATRIETLEGGRRAPKTAWVLLFAVVMVVAALTLGSQIGSDDATRTPARSSGAATVTALEPATQVPGLIKAGLQPRPYSPIATPETVEVQAPKIAEGSARVPVDVRPKFGG
jgi:predicted secreted protein